MLKSFSLLVLLTFYLSIHAFVPEKYSLSSESLVFSDKDNRLVLKDSVFLKSLIGENSIKCDQLEIINPDQDELQKIIATGNINLKKDNFFIKSKTLLMNRVSNTLHMEGDIQIKSKTLKLESDGLDYDVARKLGELYSLQGKLINLESSRLKGGRLEEIRLQSKKMTFKEEFSQLILQGKVNAFDSSSNTRVTSKRIEILFDESDNIRELIAKGNVSIQQGERNSKSREAIINFNSETVTLIGDAIVEEKGKMNISSEIIKMYLEVNKGIIQSKDQKPVKVEIPL